MFLLIMAALWTINACICIAIINHPSSFPWAGEAYRPPPVKVVIFIRVLFWISLTQGIAATYLYFGPDNW